MNKGSSVLADDTLVLTAGGSGGQSVFLSTSAGRTWTAPITIDPSVYEYGKLTLLEDQVWTVCVPPYPNPFPMVYNAVSPPSCALTFVVASIAIGF